MQALTLYATPSQYFITNYQVIFKSMQSTDQGCTDLMI